MVELKASRISSGIYEKLKWKFHSSWFLSWNFHVVSHNFAEFPEMKASLL